ncbi:LysR family transcriptional regulator [Pseudomonas sp. LRF_L74]|uniref:LysR family transcriptional regulator n=1 Tax=Pseudomonas sp. LRF_L74 TaxID=3369422 RepID=UPI003F5E2572
MRDIRTLDLNLLKALDALLDECSVTRAASRLALTQPAVSGMLVRLRESFDDPLFIRAPRGLVPTPRALALASPVKRVLEDIEGLLQPERFEPATARLGMAIAATDYAQQTILVPFLARLRLLAPGIRIAVKPVQDDQVQRQLEAGELDLALLTPETTHEGLHARRLFDERYVCTMRKDHPLATTMTLERFCAAEHAIVSYSGEAFRGVTDAALATLGRVRQVCLSVTSFLVLVEILRTSDLIAVVPQRLVAQVPDMAMVEPPLPITGFTKVAAWHERTHHQAAQRWVRAQLFGDGPDHAG